MIKINKLIIFSFSFLILAVSGSLLFLYLLVSSSIPNYQEEIRTSEIKDEITILRDNYGIPHIFSISENDSFFALGYTHAQDRLWQMEFMRRLSQGRLSEILGQRFLESDTLVRTLNIYNLAKNSLPFQDQDIIQKLESYSRGINLRLRQISIDGLGRGAPEFFLHSKTISPWTPTDSLAILKFLSFQYSGKIYSEILRAKLKLSGLSNKMIYELLEETGKTQKLKSSSLSNEYSYLFAQKKIHSSSGNFLHFDSLEKGGASNIWAVSPKRSAHNATLAATDPHIPLTSPSLWMLAHIAHKDNYIFGGTIPGIPAILIGKNKNFGWGWSSTFADDQDLYIEKIDPNNNKKYLSSLKNQVQSKEIKSRQVIIEIKDLPGKTITVQETDNGPILPDTFPGLKDIVPPGHMAAISWPGFDVNDRSLGALINLMYSSNVKNAKDKLIDFHSPIQNFLLVDKENIAIQVAGKIPLRSKSHATKGLYPSLGYIPDNAWTGYITYQSNPFILNPPSGMVANTNNKIIDREFPNHISYEWGDSQRILRLTNLLEKREFHTAQSFIDIQTDTISITARILLPLLGKDLWYQDTFKPDDSKNELRRIALNLLAEWNGNMRVHDPEPLIFAAWLDAFQKRIISDELGEFAKEIYKARPLFLEKVLRNVDNAAKWCDVVQTPQIETCEIIAKKSLDDSLAWLSLKFGPRVESWRWGDSHMSFHRSETLGRIPLISYFSNIVQETSGGQNTLMSGEFVGYGDNPYIQNRGSGLRAIYDFGEGNNSLFILSTGQSGNPVSRHYDDMVGMWKLGEYIPAIIDRAIIEGSGAQKTTFLLEAPID